MRTRLITAATIVAALAGQPHALPALAAEPEKAATAAELAGIADKLAGSLVRVEYTAQYDKGEPPSTDRWGPYRMFRAFGSATDDDSIPDTADWSELIRQERPAERGGYLVSPTRVFTGDPGLHPRFIRSIRVRFKDAVVDAKPGAWAETRGGWFIDLDQPLPGAVPLKFDPTRERPYFALTTQKLDAEWATRIVPAGGAVSAWSDGRRVVNGPGPGIAVDQQGVPVTLFSGVDLPVDGSWRADPASWPLVTADRMAAALKTLEASAASHLVRVTLNFRSPRTGDAGGPFARMRSYYAGGMMDDGEDDASTELNGLGLVLDERTVVVLASLKPKRTARLERVRVFWPDGASGAATFDGTLKDWGGLVVKLDKPASAPPAFAKAPITSLRDRLLLRAAVAVRGETRTAYFDHDRISSFVAGHHGKVFPAVESSSGGGGWGEGVYRHFLYTLAGELAAVPLERREKVTATERGGDRYFSMSSGRDQMTPIVYLLEELSRGSSAYDADNRPLSEEEENRVAWIGAELQSMTPELARASNCIDQTRGGRSGGIVTFMYPDSPATKAGLQVGDVLLRLHIEGQPKPLEVVGVDSDMGGMMDQFWQYLDQMPAEYFDQIPKPWGSVETPVTSALTEVGFGTGFEVELLRDGKLLRLPMTVTQGPPHFDSAPRFKSEEMGATVRDLTYEVRRYFQMKPAEAGVIVAKVERGSKASVAGLKPMETIRTVDDKPVANVKEFEDAIKAGGEFKLGVRRMNKGRTVKVRIEPAGTGAAPPVDEPEPAGMMIPSDIPMPRP